MDVDMDMDTTDGPVSNVVQDYHDFYDELQDFESHTANKGADADTFLSSTKDDPAAVQNHSNSNSQPKMTKVNQVDDEYGRSDSELEWLKAGSDDQEPYGFSPNEKPTNHIMTRSSQQKSSSSFLLTPARESSSQPQPQPQPHVSAAKLNQHMLPRATLLNKANHTFKSMVRVTSAVSDDDDNDECNIEDGVSEASIILQSSARSLPPYSSRHPSDRPPRQPLFKKTPQGNGNNHNKEVTFSPSPPRDLSLSPSPLLHARKGMQHHSDSKLQYSSSLSSFDNEPISPTASQRSLSVNDAMDEDSNVDHDTNDSPSVGGTGNSGMTEQHQPSRQRKKLFRGKKTLTGILRGGAMAAGIDGAFTTTYMTPKKKKSDEEQPLKDSNDSFSSYV
jgi:hypothetical protein